MQFQQKYYLLTGGEIRERADAYRGAVIAQKRKLIDFAKSLGAVQFLIDDSSMKLHGLVFDGAVPDGFTKPRKKDRLSWPKASTKRADYEDFFQFSGVVERFKPLQEFIEWLGCPEHYKFTTKDGGGGSCIGHPFRPFQLGWITADSNILLVTPDVEHYQREAEACGYLVENNALSWRMAHDGAEEILLEKWKLMVAEHEAAAKAAAA